MPLIICSVCGKQVSKRAMMCPGCGEPDPANYHLKNDWLGRIFWLFVLIIAVLLIWYQFVPYVSAAFID